MGRVRTIAMGLALAAMASGTQAATLYLEDFSGQNGLGATGVSSSAPPTIVTGSEDWTINVDGASLTATTDWFRVEDEVFEARDVDGPAVWTSQVVDVSGATNLLLSGIFSEDGDLEGETGVGNDRVDIEYSVDGGSSFILIPNVNGLGSATTSLTGNIPDANDWGTTTLSQSLPDGTGFQLRVTMVNRSDAEFLRMDDLMLTGDTLTAVPLPAGWLLLGGGLVLLARRRKS